VTRTREACGCGCRRAEDPPTARPELGRHAVHAMAARQRAGNRLRRPAKAPAHPARLRDGQRRHDLRRTQPNIADSCALLSTADVAGETETGFGAKSRFPGARKLKAAFAARNSPPVRRWKPMRSPAGPPFPALHRQRFRPGRLFSVMPRAGRSGIPSVVFGLATSPRPIRGTNGFRRPSWEREGSLVRFLRSFALSQSPKAGPKPNDRRARSRPSCAGFQHHAAFFRQRAG